MVLKLSPKKNDASNSTHQGVYVALGGEDRRINRRKHSRCECFPGGGGKARRQRNSTAKRFAGQTVTIALPGGMKSDPLLYKDNWERQTGAKVKVIASD